ncbi:MAG: type 1 glutamine amidotransferase [Paracoccaceae bacterium]
MQTTSAFACTPPQQDTKKFTALIHAVRPIGRSRPSICRRNSASVLEFDGLLIGGSPASVLDDTPWISRLLALIRSTHAAGLPIVGACFGHQAIAQALEARSGPTPGPSSLAPPKRITAPAPWIKRSLRHRLAAAHGEQVLDLPEGAEIIGEGPGCKVAAYRIGTQVFATQYHPEMTPGFIAALVEIR